MVANAVTREKMEMQSLRKENGTILQIHRSSSDQLRAFNEQFMSSTHMLATSPNTSMAVLTKQQYRMEIPEKVC